MHYLHSEIETLERVEILRDLRLGVYDVVVGINLLREGLDLPEVSLVAILDADKEGFLRSPSALIQTIGRAARHVNGQVIMYADHDDRLDAHGHRRDQPPPRDPERPTTRSMASRPARIVKEIRDLTEGLRAVAETEAGLSARGHRRCPRTRLQRLISELEKQMKAPPQDAGVRKGGPAARPDPRAAPLRGRGGRRPPEWERYRQFERHGHRRR